MPPLPRAKAVAVPARVAERAAELNGSSRVSLHMRTGTATDEEEIIARISDPMQIRTPSGPSGDFIHMKYSRWIAQQAMGLCHVLLIVLVDEDSHKQQILSMYVISFFPEFSGKLFGEVRGSCVLLCYIGFFILAFFTDFTKTWDRK